MPSTHKSVWLGASMVLLIVGLALVAAFWLSAQGMDRPGRLLAAGLAMSVGALLLALWSAQTTGQRSVAWPLVIGIASASAIGILVVVISLFSSMGAAYGNGH